MNIDIVKLYDSSLVFLAKLIWPLLIFNFFYTFRIQIIRLLERLASVKVAGSEWVFQSEIKNSQIPTVDLKNDSLIKMYDGFLSITTLHLIIKESGLLQANDKIIDELLIFKNANQKTWLIASHKQIFILLDDNSTRKDRRLIQTVFDINRTEPLDFKNNLGVGLVKFSAENIWWYYSVEIFPNTQDLSNAIKQVVKNSNL